MVIGFGAPKAEAAARSTQMLVHEPLQRLGQDLVCSGFQGDGAPVIPAQLASKFIEAEVGIFERPLLFGGRAEWGAWLKLDASTIVAGLPCFETGLYGPIRVKHRLVPTQ